MACLGVGPAFDQNMVTFIAKLEKNFVLTSAQECSIAGKCACVTYGKLFKYNSSGNNRGVCKALKGSVCYMGRIQNGTDLQSFIKADCAVSSCKGVTSVAVQKDIFLRTCGGGLNCGDRKYFSTVLLASALIFLGAAFKVLGPWI